MGKIGQFSLVIWVLLFQMFKIQVSGRVTAPVLFLEGGWPLVPGKCIFGEYNKLSGNTANVWEAPRLAAVILKLILREYIIMCPFAKYK